MTITVDGLDEIKTLVGTDLGASDWLEISQERVNTFADATGDHQWIHVDPERAATGPFGTTIAHGYLTLSLLPYFLPRMWDVQGFSMGLNYGAEKVRFPSPVPVGSTVRCGATVDTVSPVEGGVQVVLTGTIEVVDAPKPSCVAQVVYRYYI